MVYKPEKDEPISDLSTDTTSGKSQDSRSQKKTALHISDAGAKKRDRHFVSLQEQVGCTLIIVSNLMSEVKREKMDRLNVRTAVRRHTSPPCVTQGHFPAEKGVIEDGLKQRLPRYLRSPTK